MKIIVACDRRWGIGSEGKLLTHISTDLKRFKEITSNNIVVYGRKTLATFPQSKPLPNRINIVLTANPDFYAYPAYVVNDLEHLFTFLTKLKDEHSQKEIFIIGGASVYEQLLPYCNEVMVTEIDLEFPADAFFPDLSKQQNWAKTSETPWLEEKRLRFRYVSYKKIRNLRLCKLYQNDASEIRKLGLPGFKGTLRELREKLNSLGKEFNSQMHAIYDGDDLIGVARLAYPLLNSNLAYFSWQTFHSLTSHDTEVLIQAIMENNPTILRMEVLSSDVLADGVREKFVFGGEIAEMYSAYRKTFYRPEVSGPDIAFIPFSPFGYITLKGNHQENKVSGADFWREDETLSDPELQGAAELLGLTDISGRPVVKDDIVYVKKEDQDYLREAAENINSYLNGKGGTPQADYEFPQATDFQRKVWQQIAKIPYGRVATYGEIAEEVAPAGKNHRNYARAVGNACGANPLPVIIPCHRVIGKDRSLVGFTGGLDIKDHLLNLEMQYDQTVRRKEQI